MRIPGADRAIISQEKIVAYLLNIDHPDGGSKATVLAHAGFSAERPEELEFALRSQHLCLPATRGKLSPYGEKYEIVGPLTGRAGRTMMRSIWIVRHGEATPRLITLVPEKQE
ncbi:MAG: DUF6883 domain-containing protein [Thermoguttaceae bacterium]